MADNFTPLDVNKPTEQENGGEKNALSADEPTSLKDQLFTGVNKYLMLLMGIFIVVIIVALFISFQRGQKAQEEELPQTQPQAIQQKETTESKDSQDQEQGPTSRLFENRYIGTVVKIEPFNAEGGVLIELESTLSNIPEKDRIGYFFYDSETLKEKNLTEVVSSIHIENIIEIIEYLDPSNPEPPVTVEIRKQTKQASSEDIPYNIRSFAAIRKQLNPKTTKIYQRDFPGTIAAIEHSNNPEQIVLMVRRDTPDKVDTVESFHYEGDTLNKVTVLSQEEKHTLQTAQLTVGDYVIISETADFSKDYSSGLQEVIITKTNPLTSS